jgi:hypothetical protein
MPSGCVTIHRYYWYEFDGRVIPKVNTTEKSDGSTTWIDGNTANLQFVHQLQRKTTANVQTRYKTSKNPTINNNFGIQTNWGDTSINVNNSWFTQRTSGSPNSVDIAKSDDGSTYCQTQNFWRYVRESVNWSDTNTYNTETTRSACVTLKRYKTNFTGGTTVTVNGTSYTSGQTVTITGDSIPTTATVVFNHKITRTSEDTPPTAPGDKHSTIAISTSGTTGCRSGDPCGNTVNEKNTTDLPRTGTDAQRSYTETQTINAKVYPDQTITICQQMTYTYRIWGSDYDKTTADQVCITLHMAKATCSDGTTSQYGIHDGRNYASLTIFKNVNNGTDTSFASGIKDTGNHTITAWAMPGDNINFRHESCAAADLSNQFNSKGVSVSYDVSANKAGYLFGKSIGSSPYSATSVNLGTTNSNPGTGPFSGGKYTITYRSPSISSPNNAGDMYSCSGKYGSSHGAKDNYYQITSDVANTTSLRTATGLDNCKSYNYTVPSTSTEYAIGSNVGSTITQKIEWTDLWIQNDNAVNGHMGTGKASITADVKIPYNYYLHPYAQSAMGDSAVQTINPGGKLKANVYVPVMKRENTQVGSTYATHTKPTKIRVITFTMSSGEPKSAISYLNSNNGNETTSQLCAAAVSSGSAANCGLSNGDVSSTNSYVLNASTSGQFSGTASSTETGIGTASVRTNAFSGTSTALISRDGSFVSSAEVTVPESSATVGDKVCIAVAAWPSDSHNLGAVKKVDNDNQNIALSQAIGSGSKWVVSAPTCATVAKYPSFSVEGSDLTVAGSVNTHISKYGGRNYVSWAEYSIRAGGSIVGARMSSGAAGSYTTTDNSIALNTGTTAPIYAESLKNINQANSAAGLTDNNPCRRTAQTYVRNGDCSSTSEAGHFSSVANEEGIKDLLERVRDVYTRKGATGVGTNDFSNLRWVEQITGYDYLNRPIKRTVDAYITIGSKKVYDLTPMNAYACDYDEDAGAYVPNAFDAERGIKADGTRVAPFYCLSNGSIYYHVSGDAYVGPKRDTIMTEYLNFVDDLVNNPEGQETYRNPTLIFHVDGKLTLDSNLVTDNYECASYNYQRVCTGWRAVDLFEDIQTIPQVIVIADQIDITANVSRVDAWLIADGNNYSTLNTCAYDNYSGFTNNNYIKAPNNSTTNGSSLSARKCNRPILFNGPVFAEKAILNRTAGGGTAAASWNTSNTSNLSLSVGQSNYAIRGEIFNLRSDVYLWGYYQAQRNGILTTVFSQELPTRY